MSMLKDCLWPYIQRPIAERWLQYAATDGMMPIEFDPATIYRPGDFEEGGPEFIQNDIVSVVKAYKQAALELARVFRETLDQEEPISILALKRWYFLSARNEMNACLLSAAKVYPLDHPIWDKVC